MKKSPLSQKMLTYPMGLALGLMSINAQAAAVVYDKNFLSPTQKNALNQILLSSIQSQKLPSLAVAATVNDKVIFASAVGMADIGKMQVADPEKTLYRWASVSKVATDRFAQDLEEQGLLDQNANIHQYLDQPEPYQLRRCFETDASFQKFIGCTKNYGGFGPTKLTGGRCFVPTTLDSVETEVGSKKYSATVADKTLTSGDVVYKTTSGEDKCRVTYKIDKATLGGATVTVNKLLGHTAGVIHYSYLGMEAEPPVVAMSNTMLIKARKDAGKSQMEWAIAAFYPKHPLIFTPGAAKNYSTFGYNLAGVVMEKAAHKTYDKILSGHAWSLGALSMQPDYLGLAPSGPYTRSMTYDLVDGKLKANAYTTDNSYKLAGGGIMSTIVDLGRFCVGVANDGMITKTGQKSYGHSGAHPNRSKSLLSLKSSSAGDRQCIVLMTNTNHGDVDLDAVKAKLQEKLIALKAFGSYED